MAVEPLRQIKIKMGSVQRLTKEKSMYEKEVAQQEERVRKLKADSGSDPYMIKKQEEVLGECKMMVPDCARRLKQASGDLEQLLEQQRGTLSGDELFLQAETALSAAKSAV